ncbi:hypothetical protein [Pseudomonas sp. B21-053]|uniref:hypothetical protein n=1 Tax=Pseudomonas sp. B21-053 TaxID=2895493 RepID=UPI002231D63C|nr:hypothetical protein [Pseudomonas sp. B21-053]UZE13922.1 hypothetical protein LOY68_10010 [Pseudomonas sp. B21-053]
MQPRLPTMICGELDDLLVLLIFGAYARCNDREVVDLIDRYTILIRVPAGLFQSTMTEHLCPGWRMKLLSNCRHEINAV